MTTDTSKLPTTPTVTPEAQAHVEDTYKPFDAKQDDVTEADIEQAPTWNGNPSSKQTLIKNNAEGNAESPLVEDDGVVDEEAEIDDRDDGR